MQCEPAVDISICKVPNDDICLEAHVSALSRGKESTRWRASKTRHIVGVSSEERLATVGETFYDDLATKRVNDVLIIWMSYQAAYDAACCSHNGKKEEALLKKGKNV